jgi:acylphosphatase
MITQRFRIRGWVRNRTDGSVEALVQGPPQRVKELLEWARRGPPASRVDEVQLEVLPEEPPHGGFELRPTV